MSPLHKFPLLTKRPPSVDSVEMMYHCLQSNQKSDVSEFGLSKAQASFTERDHRFTLRASITHKKHTVMHVFDCAASSADELAFWRSLPEDLRVKSASHDLALGSGV